MPGAFWAGTDVDTFLPGSGGTDGTVTVTVTPQSDYGYCAVLITYDDEVVTAPAGFTLVDSSAADGRKVWVYWATYSSTSGASSFNFTTSPTSAPGAGSDRDWIGLFVIGGDPYGVGDYDLSHIGAGNPSVATWPHLSLDATHGLVVSVAQFGSRPAGTASTTFTSGLTISPTDLANVGTMPLGRVYGAGSPFFDPGSSPLGAMEARNNPGTGAATWNVSDGVVVTVLIESYAPAIGCVQAEWHSHDVQNSPALHRQSLPVIGGYIYALGGSADADATKAQRYDIAGDAWETLTSPPASLVGTTLVGFGTDVHCFAGGGADYSGQTFRTRHLVYDTTADSWSVAAAIPDGGRRGAGGASDGTYIYLTAGSSGTDEATILRYDPSGDTWDTSLTDMNLAGDTSYAAYWDGAIYERHSSPTSSENVAIRKYDIATDTWSGVASAASSRSAYGFAIINGRLYMAGGVTSGSRVSEVFYYDIAADTFVGQGNADVPDFPVARSTLALAVDGNTLWAVGGTTGTIDGATMCLSLASPTRYAGRIQI